MSELQEAFTPEPENPPLPTDLLDELRQRLDAGLTDDQWREIFGLLIRRITIHTDDVPGVRSVRLVVEYNFPANCVVPGDTGIHAEKATLASSRKQRMTEWIILSEAWRADSVTRGRSYAPIESWIIPAMTLAMRTMENPTRAFTMADLPRSI